MTANEIGVMHGMEPDEPGIAAAAHAKGEEGQSMQPTNAAYDTVSVDSSGVSKAWAPWNSGGIEPRNLEEPATTRHTLQESYASSWTKI